MSGPARTSDERLCDHLLSLKDGHTDVLQLVLHKLPLDTYRALRGSNRAFRQLCDASIQRLNVLGFQVVGKDLGVQFPAARHLTLRLHDTDNQQQLSKSLKALLKHCSELFRKLESVELHLGQYSPGNGKRLAVLLERCTSAAVVTISHVNSRGTLSKATYIPEHVPNRKPNFFSLSVPANAFMASVTGGASQSSILQLLEEPTSCARLSELVLSYPESLLDDPPDWIADENGVMHAVNPPDQYPFTNAFNTLQHCASNLTSLAVRTTSSTALLALLTPRVAEASPFLRRLTLHCEEQAASTPLIWSNLALPPSLTSLSLSIASSRQSHSYFDLIVDPTHPFHVPSAWGRLPRLHHLSITAPKVTNLTALAPITSLRHLSIASTTEPLPTILSSFPQLTNLTYSYDLSVLDDPLLLQPQPHPNPAAPPAAAPAAPDSPVNHPYHAHAPGPQPPPALLRLLPSCFRGSMRSAAGPSSPAATPRGYAPSATPSFPFPTPRSATPPPAIHKLTIGNIDPSALPSLIPLLQPLTTVSSLHLHFAPTAPDEFNNSGVPPALCPRLLPALHPLTTLPALHLLTLQNVRLAPGTLPPFLAALAAAPALHHLHLHSCVLQSSAPPPAPLSFASLLSLRLTACTCPAPPPRYPALLDALLPALRAPHLTSLAITPPSPLDLHPSAAPDPAPLGPTHVTSLLALLRHSPLLAPTHVRGLALTLTSPAPLLDLLADHPTLLNHNSLHPTLAAHLAHPNHLHGILAAALPHTHHLRLHAPYPHATLAAALAATAPQLTALTLTTTRLAPDRLISLLPDLRNLLSLTLHSRLNPVTPSVVAALPAACPHLTHLALGLCSAPPHHFAALVPLANLHTLVLDRYTSPVDAHRLSEAFSIPDPASRPPRLRYLVFRDLPVSRKYGLSFPWWYWLTVSGDIKVVAHSVRRRGRLRTARQSLVLEYLSTLS